MKMTRMTVAAALFAAVAALGFSQSIELVGAGATFPAPFYTKLFDEYNRQFGIKVNYQSIGSGGGQAQIKGKTVDFGASDQFVNDAGLASYPAALVHIPAVAGSIVPSYNLSGNPELKFTGDVLADIYLGKIKRWNDARLTALNPSANLPNTSITVVHRSDGSGTTAGWTDYLSKVSDEWKTKVGTNSSVAWPAGVGGKGNEGVAGLVRQLPASIGYVELIYALQNKMTFGSVRNKTGTFIKASLASTAAATAGAIPDDTRVSLTDTPAPDGYPISTLTWILVYKEQNYGGRTQAQAATLVQLLWWMIHDGQKYAEALSYAQLSSTALAKAETIVKSITFNGAPLMK